MINKVYKVNFDRSAEDLSLQYEGLSDTEKECMSDLSAESFFDYEDNKGKYICYLITTPLELIKALLQMTAVMKTSQIWPNGAPTADTVKNQVYANVETTLELIQQDLESILSKNVKTI